MNSTVFNKNNKFLIAILIILIIPTLLAIYFAVSTEVSMSIKDTAVMISVNGTQLTSKKMLNLTLNFLL